MRLCRRAVAMPFLASCSSLLPCRERCRINEEGRTSRIHILTGGRPKPLKKTRMQETRPGNVCRHASLAGHVALHQKLVVSSEQQSASVFRVLVPLGTGGSPFGSATIFAGWGYYSKNPHRRAQGTVIDLELPAAFASVNFSCLMFCLPPDQASGSMIWSPRRGG